MSTKLKIKKLLVFFFILELLILLSGIRKGKKLILESLYLHKG